MQLRSSNKYSLRDLHQEIDYFDRKIAYCENYEQFDSERARAASLRKLVVKRESLVKAALDMANRGIKCDAKYLPRSFRAPAVRVAS
jgi:hypothetical protein